MKVFKRLMCLILSLLLMCLATLIYSSEVRAASSKLTNASIQAKEKEIKGVEAEKKELQNSMSDIKKIKADLEQSKSDLSAYVEQLDSNLEEVQDKIEDLKEKVAAKEEEIKQKEVEYDEAIAVQTAQYEAMKIRIKFMYEKGDSMYMDMILQAGSFGEALNKAEYIESLSAYDKRMLDEYVEYSEYVALCKQLLEEEKSMLEETKRAQEKEEENLNELIAAKEEEINKVTQDISDKEAAIKEYEAEIADRNATIKALEAAVAAERKALEAEARRYDGGKFANPCPSYVRISDDYGYRIHPTLGVKQFHSGIDMAASSGSPILAAYSGKVVAASYSSSMGNYIMINHGDGLYTIYMHASKLYVSQGAEVKKGDKIAAVGSTGRSTGPHLHFSVRLNGEYVSPWNYIK